MRPRREQELGDEIRVLEVRHSTTCSITVQADESGKLRSLTSPIVPRIFSPPQASKRRCQDDCTALRLSVDSLQAKAEQFNALQAQLDAADKGNKALQQRDTMHAITMKSLAEAHEADRLRLHELDRKVELLTMDKMFLSKELDIATERGKAADKEKERLNNKIDDLRKHKDQLVNQLSVVTAQQQHSTTASVH